MNQGNIKPNLEKIENFWKRERVDIAQRNVDLSSEYERHLPELRRRLSHRTTFLITCMDERCGFVGDPLDLLHGEPIVMASVGGRISAEDFDRLYGTKIRHSIQARRQTAIYLCTHECAGHPDKGCIPFDGDMPTQKDFFMNLQVKIKALYPEAFTHVMMHDTGTNRLSEISMDERDDHIIRVLSGEKNLLGETPDDLGRAGYGIYIGDAYRFWVESANRYQRLSSLNPNLPADLRFCITVTIERSSADLDVMPLVIHIDNPIYPDSKLSGACRRNTEEAIAEVLKDGDIKDMIDNGRIRIIKTETETGSMRGFAIG